MCSVDTCIHKDISEKGFQGAHLSSASDSTSGPCIDPACFDLLLLLPVTSIPERLDCSMESFVEIG
jgi:hypothetical protein